MPARTIGQAILVLLRRNSLLTSVDIARKLRKDKARVSGYLEAMVDYGKISVKKVGNGRVYFLNKERKS